MSDWSDVKSWAAEKAEGPYEYGIGQRVLALIAENERLAALLECAQGDIRTGGKIIAERDRLLSAIPECPVHGPCVPHAIEWVEKIILVAKGLTAENEALRKDAERYRWLRGYHNPESEAPFICQQRLMFGKLYYAGPLIAGALDQEVDSAMGKVEQS